jgi:hypothetical protein
MERRGSVFDIVMNNGGFGKFRGKRYKPEMYPALQAKEILLKDMNYSHFRRDVRFINRQQRQYAKKCNRKAANLSGFGKELIPLNLNQLRGQPKMIVANRNKEELDKIAGSMNQTLAAYSNDLKPECHQLLQQGINLFLGSLSPVDEYAQRCRAACQERIRTRVESLLIECEDPDLDDLLPGNEFRIGMLL